MWWLSLVMLVNRAGTMVVPFMTLYLTQARHYSISKAGLVMSIFGMGAVCGGFLGGKLTDKFGFYNIQLSALLCGGIMFIVLGQVSDYTLICACTFILAVLNESFRPANATAIAQYSHEGNRTRCYSLNRLSINLGWAAGGALGGFIASRNYQALFWIDGFTNISAAILLRLLLSPSKNSATPAKAEKHVDKGRPAYKDGPYLVFIVLTIMYGLCFFQIFSTQPVFFKTVLNLTPAFIGGIMGFNGLMIAAFEMTLVFVLERRQKNNVYIMLGTMLVGFSFVMFNLFPGAETLVVCSTIVITIGEMLSMPFMNTFWISRTNSANRGQYAGLYTAAWSIAQVLGPYAGSRIAETQGFYTLWWVTGGLSVLTALGFLQLKPRKA
jgi:predicted MFS family arabinose efflux permease